MSEDLVAKWPRERALPIREVLERIRVCGCGSNAHWKCLLELLMEAENHTDRGFYRDQWFEFGAKVLDKWELIEHGTGIGFAWLTDEGRLVLEFLRDFGIEQHDHASGDGHPFWAEEYSWTGADDPNDTYSDWVNAMKAQT